MRQRGYGMLEHGGRLRLAANEWGIAVESWLDLSTGINPDGWPVPPIPPHLWQRLPEDDDGLLVAAQHYYQAPHILPVAGSQAALQALPALRAPGRVGMFFPSYAEHAHAWEKAGHTVVPLTADAMQLDDIDVLLLIHPNNPTGTHYDSAQLLNWHSQLAARGGWLVADEAYIDADPVHSLTPYTNRSGLIVMRSLGKFFGLAGARVGFVMAQAELLQRLQAELGPWTIAHPARWLATQALQDSAWQAYSRAQLGQSTERLARLLQQHELAVHGRTALFHWLITPHAAALYQHLAQCGILTRLFSEPVSLRIGLPGTEADWQRLEQGLSTWQR